MPTRRRCVPLLIRASWGDCGIEGVDYRYDDPAITGSAGGDWLSSVAYRVETWIPERREHFVRAFYAGIQAGTIYLEDFEDGELNTPGIFVNDITNGMGNFWGGESMHLATIRSMSDL